MLNGGGGGGISLCGGGGGISLCGGGGLTLLLAQWRLLPLLSLVEDVDGVL
jgi:hypothetical protein